MPRTFPVWSDLFRVHPDLKVEALNRFLANSRHIVVEARIRGEPSRDWSEVLRALPKVVSATRLDRIGRPNDYRLTWEAPEYYASLLRKYDLLGVIPFALTARHVDITLALSRARLQQLVRDASKRRFETEVLEVRPLPRRTGLGDLTSKQRERFQIAVQRGYFDVPRRTTLTELARTCSVGKSALSESLALARQKVLVAVGRVLLAEDDAARNELLGQA